MDARRWAEIQAVFDRLVELNEGDRQRHLVEIAARDEALSEAVESLLSADAGAGDPLDDEISPFRPIGAASRSAGGAAARDADPLGFVGLTLSHFRVIEPLGAGGMGVVYRAEDLRLGRVVALKLPLPQYQLDASARQRFLREARSAASLDHPNLCTIHEVGEAEDGKVFLAMPLYAGRTLKDRLALPDPMPVDEAIDIARQIAEGLGCAHAAGIVHRDLKPANVMLLPNGTVKILDFGLAKARDASVTEAGMLAGTVAYMAPEQIRGEPSDNRSDFWALGVVLFEMLTGRRPFSADSEAAVAHAILHRKVPSVRAGRLEVPEALARIVERLMSRARDDRYPAAVALLFDLSRVAQPEARAIPLQPPGRRFDSLLLRKTVFALGTLLLIALAVPGVYRDRPSVEPVVGPLDLAVFPFCVSGPDSLAAWGQRIALLLGQTLDGLGDLRNVDQNTLLTASSEEQLGCRDRERASALAGRHGADTFVLGQLLATGGEITANVSLYDVEGRRLVTVSSTIGSASPLADLNHDIARQLATLRPGVDRNAPVWLALQSTGSIEAAKHYVEGVRRMREGGPAGLSFVEALRIDSTFALAWVRLSWLRNAGGERPGRALEAAERAARYAEGMAPRERGFLSAWLASLRGEIPEAMEMYRVHLGRYPDDIEAWGELADLQLHFGPLLGTSVSDAREGFETVLEARPDDQQALNHLGWLSNFEGRIAESRAFHARRLRGARPDLPHATGLAAQSGSPAEISGVMDALAQPHDFDSFLLPTIALRNHNPAFAERLLRLAAEPARSATVRGMAHVHLASIAVMHGRGSAAGLELDSAARFDETSAVEHRALLAANPIVEVARGEVEALRSDLVGWDAEIPVDTAANPWISPHQGMHRHLRLYLIGLLSVRLGEASTAAGYADSLDRMESPWVVPALAPNLANGIRAYVAWSAGDTLATLQWTERIQVRMVFPYYHSSAFASHPLERFLRAESLLALGRGAEALLWYEGLTEPVNPSHWPYIGMANLRLFEIYTDLGDVAAATRHYQRVAALWAESDPRFRTLLEQTAMMR